MGTPVSGPGKFSQRTDKQPIRDIPNADYGEQKAYNQLQQDAPMASSPELPKGASFGDLFGDPTQRITPLTADTTQPGTPVTDGAALGPGAGADMFGKPDQKQSQTLASYLPVLEFMANQPGSSDAARNLVRQIKYSL